MLLGWVITYNASPCLIKGFPCTQVWWLPKDRRQWVHQNYPNFIQVTKSADTPLTDLQHEHIQRMNEDWGIPLSQFRQYQEANLSVSMFFVESVFMYNYAWCMGVGAVTTGNCKLLSTVNDNPLLVVSCKH